MVYTLTYNPSIDYLISIDTLSVGEINRARKTSYFIGGKGVNVSQVLLELGIQNTALGFVAGFTGEEIENGLRQKGCHTDFVHLPEGFSRINLKFAGVSETGVNTPGPIVDAISMKALYEKIKQIGPDDILILAGSVSSQMGNDSFASLIAALPYRDTKVIIDTTGESLLNSLCYHPFLIKPNITELSEIFHEDFSSSNHEKIVEAAKNLQLKGACNVLVSLGADGAILVTSDGQVMYNEAPCGIAVNTVGSGDSMVAGFVAGYLESKDLTDAFIMGLCAGSATAFNEGLATCDDVMQLYHLMR